jgi:hypothetical protein
VCVWRFPLFNDSLRREMLDNSKGWGYKYDINSLDPNLQDPAGRVYRCVVLTSEVIPWLKSQQLL